MTNKQWIKRVLAHDDGVPVPYNLMFSPLPRQHYRTDDVEGHLDLPIRMTGPQTIKPLYASPREFGSTATDEFGVVWTTNEIDRGAPVGPCLKKPDLSGHTFPDPAAEYRFDGVALSDDYGMQKSLLISPADWRRFVKLHLAEIFGTARAAGRVVFLHSCGNIRAVVPDLIEIGLDVLHPIRGPLAGAGRSAVEVRHPPDGQGAHQIGRNRDALRRLGCFPRRRGRPVASEARRFADGCADRRAGRPLVGLSHGPAMDALPGAKVLPSVAPLAGASSRLCHDALTMIEYGLGMGLDRINPEEARWRPGIIQKREEIIRFRSLETRRRRLQREEVE